MLTNAFHAATGPVAGLPPESRFQFSVFLLTTWILSALGALALWAVYAQVTLAQGVLLLGALVSAFIMRRAQTLRARRIDARLQRIRA